ncbi:MAG: YnhF family membrane protein [Plesiomonas shigelloides]
MDTNLRWALITTVGSLAMIITYGLIAILAYAIIAVMRDTGLYKEGARLPLCFWLISMSKMRIVLRSQTHSDNQRPPSARAVCNAWVTASRLSRGRPSSNSCCHSAAASR